MPLCNRPWKSTPTSSPSARTSRRRCTAPSSAVGESIHATASAHTHQQSTSTTGPPRTGCIHLHRGEPLRLAPLCRRKQPREVVAADPPVHAHAVAHRAAEQRVHGHAERLSLDVPQRDVEPRERALRPWAMQSESAGYISAPGDGATHHQHGPAGVEAAAHGGLPDVLDAVRSRANEALQVDERALDGLGVPLERCLAPADGAVGGFDAHEEPPGRHAEGLPGPCDRPLSIAGMHRRMGSAD